MTSDPTTAHVGKTGKPMKTDELILAITRDGARIRHRPILANALIILTSYAAVMGLFFLFLGLRRDIALPGATTAIMTKLAIAAAMMLSGLVLARRLLQPAEGNRKERWLLAAAPVVLAVALMVDIQQSGLVGWQDRLIGTHGLRCLILIPLLAALPLAAMLSALRSGAVIHRKLAGASAAIAATGMGTTLYALNCVDDSPLFIAFWYGLATFIVMAVSLAVSRRALAW